MIAKPPEPIDAAIRDPSCDHACGERENTDVVVTPRSERTIETPPASALATYSVPPFGGVLSGTVNAIFRPSGDQTGALPAP